MPTAEKYEKFEKFAWVSYPFVHDASSIHNMLNQPLSFIVGCALPLRQPASSACFGATPQLPSKRRIRTPPRLVVDRVRQWVYGLKGNIHRAKPGSHAPAQLLSLSVSALCTYLASVVARCSHRAARLVLRAVRSPRRAALSSAVRAPCRASLLGAARSAAPSSEGCSAVSARCCTFSSSLLGAARSS